jgi:hypothetical protein
MGLDCKRAFMRPRQLTALFIMASVASVVLTATATATATAACSGIRPGGACPARALAR